MKIVLNVVGMIVMIILLCCIFWALFSAEVSIAPVSEANSMPKDVEKFQDGDVTCYVMRAQEGGLATGSWNFFGGISCL